MCESHTVSGDGFPAVANFDSDDRAEVVVVSGGAVWAFDDDGSHMWGPVLIPGGGRSSPGRLKRSRGPCYQWTGKIRGKTVTVALSACQAKVFQKGIDNQRKLGRITRQMRKLSLEILEATTQGVKRGKPRTWRRVPLSQCHSKLSPNYLMRTSTRPPHSHPILSIARTSPALSPQFPL